MCSSAHLSRLDEAHALEPSLEERLAADGTEAAAREHLADRWVHPKARTQRRPPAHTHLHCRSKCTAVLEECLPVPQVLHDEARAQLLRTAHGNSLRRIEAMRAQARVHTAHLQRERLVLLHRAHCERLDQRIFLAVDLAQVQVPELTSVQCSRNTSVNHSGLQATIKRKVHSYVCWEHSQLVGRHVEHFQSEELREALHVSRRHRQILQLLYCTRTSN